MATLDTSIYAQFGAKPVSFVDSMREFAQIEDDKIARKGNKLALLINEQKYADMQRQRERGNALDALLRQGDPSETPQARSQRLRAGGFFQEADAMDAAEVGRQKSVAEADKTRAEAEKKQLEVLHSKIDRHTQVLGAISTPQEAVAWLQEGQGAGLIDPQKAAAFAQQVQAMTPQQFQQWKQRMMIGGMQLKDQVEQQWKAKEFDLKANNELIGPDGQVNQQLLGAKQSVARAGASNVQINTGQKGLDNEFKLRGEFKSEPVYKAHQEMTAAYNQIKQSLGQATPAGDLAGATKIMKLLDPGSVVRESELGMAMQASGLLDRLTNYAQMTISGQKLTPQQRKDFQALADALYSESVNQYNAKRDEYQRLGGEYGLNADRALGRGVDAPKPAAPQQSEKVRRFNPATGKIE